MQNNHPHFQAKYVVVLSVFIQHKYIFPSNLSSSARSFLVSFITNEEREYIYIYACLMTQGPFLPHMEAMFITSQAQTARHKVAASTACLFVAIYIYKLDDNFIGKSLTPFLFI